ncbi:unnamed protein product [Vitrella brassicaformis CCMP3155]|uniref:Uncharacterized protein n=1 Tax=Vitrella brassicaformis (strain CCMP3155) TaxID=1169540 RepID=A0A0G4H0M4_VITBC|nr:unnamed protein product [Vitrella brassicaformis CCMP3155]|eukprot:CEM36886.1 unnamed protein product [Vitrella brassicaformis CCMP3155]
MNGGSLAEHVPFRLPKWRGPYPDETPGKIDVVLFVGRDSSTRQRPDPIERDVNPATDVHRLPNFERFQPSYSSDARSLAEVLSFIEGMKDHIRGELAIPAETHINILDGFGCSVNPRMMEQHGSYLIEIMEDEEYEKYMSARQRRSDESGATLQPSTDPQRPPVDSAHAPAAPSFLQQLVHRLMPSRHRQGPTGGAAAQTSDGLREPLLGQFGTSEGQQGWSGETDGEPGR